MCWKKLFSAKSFTALGTCAIGTGTFLLGIAAFNKIPDSVEKLANAATTYLKASNKQREAENKSIEVAHFINKVQDSGKKSRQNQVLTETILATEIIKLGKGVSSEKKMEAIATLKAYAPEIEIFQPKAAQLLSKIQKEASASLNQNIEQADQSEKEIIEFSNQFDAIARQSFNVPDNVTNQELMKLKEVPEEKTRGTSQQEKYKQR